MLDGWVRKSSRYIGLSVVGPSEPPPPPIPASPTPPAPMPKIQYNQARSEYGGEIPLAFGNCGLPGTCVWASDVRGTAPDLVLDMAWVFATNGNEARTEYEIAKLFANGRLIWHGGLAILPGSWEVARYSGAADQAQDPTMVADLGAANTPAYRDVFMAVFTDFPLEEFDFTVPAISAELEGEATGCVEEPVDDCPATIWIPGTDTTLSEDGLTVLKGGEVDPESGESSYSDNDATTAHSTGLKYFELRAATEPSTVIGSPAYGLRLEGTPGTTVLEAYYVGVSHYAHPYDLEIGYDTFGGTQAFIHEGDVVRVACNLDLMHFWFALNDGPWNPRPVFGATPASTGDPVAGTNPINYGSGGVADWTGQAVNPACFMEIPGDSVTGAFAAADFTYAIPEGFEPWDDCSCAIWRDTNAVSLSENELVVTGTGAGARAITVQSHTNTGAGFLTNTYYFEVTLTNFTDPSNFLIGIADAAFDPAVHDLKTYAGAAVLAGDQHYYVGGVDRGTLAIELDGTGLDEGNVIGVRVDLDTPAIHFRRLNAGVMQSTNFATVNLPVWAPSLDDTPNHAVIGLGSGDVATCNFGGGFIKGYDLAYLTPWGACAVLPLCGCEWDQLGANIIALNNGQTVQKTSSTAPTRAMISVGHSSGQRYFEFVVHETSTGTYDAWPVGGITDSFAGGIDDLEAFHFPNNGDVFGLAIDMDLNKYWMSQNGVWTYGEPGDGSFGSGLGLVGIEIFPYITLANNLDTVTGNFTSDSFLYTPPEGYLPWCECATTSTCGCEAEEIPHFSDAGPYDEDTGLYGGPYADMAADIEDIEIVGVNWDEDRVYYMSHGFSSTSYWYTIKISDGTLIERSTLQIDMTPPHSVGVTMIGPYWNKTDFLPTTYKCIGWHEQSGTSVPRLCAQDAESGMYVGDLEEGTSSHGYDGVSSGSNRLGPTISFEFGEQTFNASLSWNAGTGTADAYVLKIYEWDGGTFQHPARETSAALFDGTIVSHKPTYDTAGIGLHTGLVLGATSSTQQDIYWFCKSGTGTNHRLVRARCTLASFVLSVAYDVIADFDPGFAVAPLGFGYDKANGGCFLHYIERALASFGPSDADYQNDATTSHMIKWSDAGAVEWEVHNVPAYGYTVSSYSSGSNALKWATAGNWHRVGGHYLFANKVALDRTGNTALFPYISVDLTDGTITECEPPADTVFTGPSTNDSTFAMWAFNTLDGQLLGIVPPSNTETTISETGDEGHWTGHTVVLTAGGDSTSPITAAPLTLVEFIERAATYSGMDPDEDFDIGEGIDRSITGAIITEEETFADLLRRLGRCYGFDFFEAEKIMLVKRVVGSDYDTDYSIPESDVLEGDSRGISTTRPEDNTPLELRLGYIDPESRGATAPRFQYKQRPARRLLYPIRATQSDRKDAFAVPIVMDVTEAQILVGATLFREAEERIMHSVALPPEYIKAHPCDVVTITTGDTSYDVINDAIEISPDFRVGLRTVNLMTDEDFSSTSPGAIMIDIETLSGGNLTDWETVLRRTQKPNRNYAESATYASSTTVMPIDDTIPQITEGVEALSVTLTPVSATSRLRVRATVNVGISSSGNVAAALFVNGGANAVQTKVVTLDGNNYVAEVTLEYEYVPGATSLQTLAVRVGPNAGTVYINGTAGARLFGGAMKSTIVVEEIHV